MPRVLGYDVETTGLDTKNDRIVEIGCSVWDTDLKLPLAVFSNFIHTTIPEGSEQAFAINKINPEWLEKGISLYDAMDAISKLCSEWDVKYVVAHNGENYDKPITMAELERYPSVNPILKNLPWIDTRADLPFEVEPTSRKLSHLALDHGFMNPFPHRALFDVLTMLKVMSGYDFDKTVENSRTPWVIARALVDYDNREKAKEFRFSWENIGEEKFPKMWVMKIKENKLEELQSKTELKGFKTVRIK